MRSGKPAIGCTHPNLAKDKGRQTDGPVVTTLENLISWRLSWPVPSWLPLSLRVRPSSRHPRQPPELLPHLLPVSPPPHLLPVSPPPPQWVRALQHAGYESPQPPRLLSRVPPERRLEGP